MMQEQTATLEQADRAAIVDVIADAADAPRTDAQVKIYCASLFGCKPRDIRII